MAVVQFVGVVLSDPRCTAGVVAGVVAGVAADSGARGRCDERKWGVRGCAG